MILLDKTGATYSHKCLLTESNTIKIKMRIESNDKKKEIIIEEPIYENGYYDIEWTWEELEEDQSITAQFFNENDENIGRYKLMWTTKGEIIDTTNKMIL